MRPSRETFGERWLIHGHGIGKKKTRTYSSWRNAKTRCFNERNAKFKQYGARGITMCKEWAEDFCAFLADMGECPPGLTLDRIDVNGNYEPGNCRWATAVEQSRNKRDSITALIDGKEVFLKAYAEENGLRYKSLWWHIRCRNRSAQEAIEILVNKKRKRRSAPNLNSPA